MAHKIIKVKPVNSSRPQKTPRRKSDEKCARLCYYYPVYTLSEARRLPAKDVNLMLREAEKERFDDYYWKLLITTAPHTKKGALVTKLKDKIKEILTDEP